MMLPESEFMQPDEESVSPSTPVTDLRVPACGPCSGLPGSRWHRPFARRGPKVGCGRLTLVTMAYMDRTRELVARDNR